MPISRQALITLRAISPRLAIRIFRREVTSREAARDPLCNPCDIPVHRTTGASRSLSRGAPATRGSWLTPSQRNITVFLRRILVPFVPQRFQSVDQPGTGVTGVDDVVDVPA